MLVLSDLERETLESWTRCSTVSAGQRERAEIVNQWRQNHPRIALHFTPTAGSWLNLVEVFFAIITRQASRRGSFDSVRQLTAAIKAFINADNQRCRRLSGPSPGTRSRPKPPSTNFRGATPDDPGPRRFGRITHSLMLAIVLWVTIG